MKNLLLTAVLAAAALLPAVTRAQSAVWAGGTTNGASTLSWIIVPAKSANNGVPVCTLINATSDKAGSVVQSYIPTALATANYASATTSVPVNQTNGFTVNDYIVIRHLGDEQYEKRQVTTFTSGTNLTLTAAPLITSEASEIPRYVQLRSKSTFQ